MDNIIGVIGSISLYNKTTVYKNQKRKHINALVIFINPYYRLCIFSKKK